MAAPANSSTTTEAAAAAEVTARAVCKRYEALVVVKSKAMKGKGAWYWAHLEPMLVHGVDSGLPKAVKLRCSLCNAVFSASNPSRTASEHLKRGTCANFSSPVSAAAASSSSPRPISSLPPFHQRPSSSLAIVDCSAAATAFSSSPTPLPLPPPPPALPAPHQRLVLSGGKEDLDALAMLEDSVKRLKSPKASPGPALPKPQADAALSLLANWLLESGAAASPSSVSHPKLRSFLHQIGLPSLLPRHLTGPILDSRFRTGRAESLARARSALFFQLDSAGWNPANDEDGQCFISLAVNLPNGATVFHRSILIDAPAPSDYAEDVLRSAVTIISEDGGPNRCAGIVADRFKSKALRHLEAENKCMVNLHCQLRGFNSLIKDFTRDLPLFCSTAASCFRLAAFFNGNSLARALLHKHQLQDVNHSYLLHSSPLSSGFDSVFPMLEDIMDSSHSLQSAVVENEFKLLTADDPTARELAEMIGNVQFWTEFEAMVSLVNLVKAMAKEIEAERPVVGRCLPLWEELRGKVKDWCSKFNVKDTGAIDRIFERRFKKNYHPAWSAAFILDPLYLTKDAGGKYLPPFKYLTPEQEKDVDRLIMRLVSREEAHIALMELMKWRTEGLDPLYAQAVQVKQLDPATGKMKVANPQSSRLVWETCLSELKSLGKVAVRLIFLHCTASQFRCSPSLLRLARRSPAVAEQVEKLVFVSAHSRCERSSFSAEHKDSEIFGEEDEPSAEASSV